MARILFVRAFWYPMDARVSREIGALVRAGHDVDIVCAAQPGKPSRERIAGVGVYRLPIERRRGGALRTLYEIVAFQLGATVAAALLHLRHRYQVVQVNSLPDWLVFAALVPRLLGARIVLDLHECTPEYAQTKYQLGARHPIVGLIAALEQAAIRFADQVITCTAQMRERFIARGAPPDKLDVVLNSFDDDRFDARAYAACRRPADGAFVLECHGTIDANYGIDLVIRALALLRERIPTLRLEIYGDGTARAGLEELTRTLRLEDRVFFSRGFLPMLELWPRIAAADVGVVPIRRDAFRDLTHCNKMYDFVALERPVVISRTPAVEAYFGEGCFQYFESGDAQDLARAIAELYDDVALRGRLVERARTVAEPYRWQHQGERYVGLVARTLRPSLREPTARADSGAADGSTLCAAGDT
jgi:glycosyltransferase involved in cell wall biosynthesis